MPSAVSYTLQVDDSSAFSAPLVRNLSRRRSSWYVASGLATTPHFWRVRGVNSAGVAGAWSAVRSFTPQAASASGRVVDDRHQSLDGRGRERLERNGGPERGRARGRRAHHAVEQQSRGCQRAGSGHRARQQLHGALSPSRRRRWRPARRSRSPRRYNGTTRTATLTVTPAASAPPPASLQSVALTPSSVVGGSNAQGTVTLSGGAPQAGAVVSLSSSNPGVAGVPASLTVLPGPRPRRSPPRRPASARQRR